MQIADMLVFFAAFNSITADNITNVLPPDKHVISIRQRHRNQFDYGWNNSPVDDKILHINEYGIQAQKFEESPPSLICPDGLLPLISPCYTKNPVCYTRTEDGFPFDCEYLDYFKVGNTIPVKGTRFLMKQHPLYGYFEITEPGSQFRRLLNEGHFLGVMFGNWYFCANGLLRQVESEICFFEFEVSFGQCNDTSIDGLCFYDGNRYNFCENFLKICGTDCDCVDYRGDFICEKKGRCGQNCKECIEKFESYPPPDVTLETRGRNIYVIVKNALKIAEKDALELHCFSENKRINYDMIWEKYNISELMRNGDTIIYEIETDHGGLFWCEYFTYPRMELRRSNNAILHHEGVISFILNVSITITETAFVPYRFPLTTSHVLLGRLYWVVPSMEIFILAIHPVISNKFVRLSYRITVVVNKDGDDKIAYNDMQEVITRILEVDTWMPTRFLSLAPADRCLAIIDEETHFAFPTVGIGRVAVSATPILDKNGLPIMRRCLGSYTTGAFWDVFDKIVVTGEPSSITDDLNYLLASNISPEQLNEDLFNLLKSTEDVIPFDVYLISEILTRIVSSNERFDQMTFTNTVNEVMRFPTPVLSKAQQALNATDIVLYNYDVMLGAIANSNSTNNKSDGPTIFKSDLILAQVANIETTGINGMAVFKRDNSYVMESLVRIQSFHQIISTDLVFATYLSKNFLDYLKANHDHENDMHLVTALYLSDALFDPKNTDRIATYAVSIFIPNFNSILLNLTLPVYFGVEGSDPTCAFWKYGLDEALSGIFGSWKYQKEALDRNTNTICNFEHMTHFALLVNAPSSPSLHLFNRITSIASVVGTTIIILTAIIFSNWRKQAGTIVLLNYAATVLIQHALLLLFDLGPEKGSVFCKGIGILIHYILLVQFCWSLVISYVQYLKLVVVFEKRPTNIVLKFSLLTWLVPILLVGIIAGLAVENYNCLISGYSFYFGLLLPISIIIIANLAMFTRILHSLFCSKVKVPVKSREYYKVSVCIILFFLMGLTWVFGLMANLFDSLVLSYIFSALTGAHGLVICIYFVMLEKQTRRMWLYRIGICCGVNDKERSTFSSSTITLEKRD